MTADDVSDVEGVMLIGGFVVGAIFLSVGVLTHRIAASLLGLALFGSALISYAKKVDSYRSQKK